MAEVLVVSVFVEGRVQRVGYRVWTVRQATELGLQGWVRNLQDGRVEMLLVGPSDIVEVMIERAHRGPEKAQVDRLSRSPVAAVPDLTGFAQWPTV